MRFDSERAVSFLPQLATLRLAGSADVRAAADLVAHEFARAGLVVHRGEPSASTPREPSAAEVWLIAGLTIAAGVFLQATAGTGPGGSTPWTLAAVFAGLAVAAVLLHLIALGFRRHPAIREPSVRGEVPPPERPNGRPEHEPEPETRVVFLTHLETRPPAASHRFRRDLVVLDGIWLAALWLPCLIVGGRAWLSTAGPALLIGLGLIHLVRRVDPWIQHKAPHPADNRTGLALLVELARAWTRDPRRATGAAFVASGVSPGSWNEEDLRWVLGPSAGAATLVVNLEAPGLGGVIYLSGNEPALSLVERAARDLWLPARVAQWHAVPLDHRAVGRTGVAALSLVGDLDDPRVDPKMLGATAQLATEVALRWLSPSRPETIPEQPAV